MLGSPNVSLTVTHWWCCTPLAIFGADGLHAAFQVVTRKALEHDLTKKVINALLGDLAVLWRHREATGASCKKQAQKHGPLARYLKLRVAHAPGMLGTVSPPHHGLAIPRCITALWCMLVSLTSGFLWSRWRGKCSRHFWHMHNPQFYVPGKRPMSQADSNIYGVCVEWS